MHVSRALAVVASVALVAACATRPQPLSGEFPDFYPDQATERSLDAQVRWGGTLVATRPEADRTCLEVLAQELDRDYRPLASDHSRGRFIACRERFLEPQTFEPGRQVTIVGRLSQFSAGKIGEFEYRYPVLDADVVYLWPGVAYGTYYYPYYYPAYYYHPWYPYYGYPFRFHFHGHVVRGSRIGDRPTLRGAARRSGG